MTRYSTALLSPSLRLKLKLRLEKRQGKNYKKVNNSIFFALWSLNRSEIGRSNNVKVKQKTKRHFTSAKALSIQRMFDECG